MSRLTPADENMPREVKAKYTHGILEPLEDLHLEEGEEVTISVQRSEDHPVTADQPQDGFEQAAGGWVGLVDTEELLRIIKESRKVITPPVDLGL